jgi:hypothetical protein
MIDTSKHPDYAHTFDFAWPPTFDGQTRMDCCRSECVRYV